MMHTEIPATVEHSFAGQMMAFVSKVVKATLPRFVALVLGLTWRPDAHSIGRAPGEGTSLSQQKRSCRPLTESLPNDASRESTPSAGPLVPAPFEHGPHRHVRRRHDRRVDRPRPRLRHA